MVTNLKGMSFGSLSSSPFTAPACFFALLGIGVVGVHLAMVGCLSCRFVSQDQYASKKESSTQVRVGK